MFALKCCIAVFILGGHFQASASIYSSVSGRMIKKTKDLVIIKNNKGEFKIPKSSILLKKDRLLVDKTPPGKKVSLHIPLKSKMTFLPKVKRGQR